MLLASAVLAAPASVKPQQVLKERDKWHTKEVASAGVVAEFEAKTSKRGNPYTVFKLTEGDAKINVYLRGRLPADKPIKNGDKVVVTGIFRKEKKVGSAVFRNEIDATPKKDKPYGVKKS